MKQDAKSEVNRRLDGKPETQWLREDGKRIKLIGGTYWLYLDSYVIGQFKTLHEALID